MIAVVTPLVIATVAAGMLNTFADRRRIARSSQALERAEAKAGQADELALPGLWDVTHRRLDYYHDIATSQARHSFRNAQLAMGLGFALLAIFAVLALNATSSTTGIVGAVSAALGGYVGRTFIRSQEAAAAHLRAYFEQPLQFSRYLAAERMLAAVEGLSPEQRATVTSELLRAMVAVEQKP